MLVQIYARYYIEELIEKSEFPPNTAVISFCDYGTHPSARVNFNGVCNRIMYVEVDDLDLEDIDDYDEFLPEAKEIAEFIIDAYNGGMNIICQCECGESRSAGCAAAIEEYFNRTGINVFKDYRYYPNKMIYNKIFDALNDLDKRVYYLTQGF